MNTRAPVVRSRLARVRSGLCCIALVTAATGAFGFGIGACNDTPPTGSTADAGEEDSGPGRTPLPDPETIPLVETPPDGTPAAKHGHLHVDGTFVVDEHGDKVQLRGPSSMWLNSETSGFAYNEAGLQFARDNWHMTVLRAAMGMDSAGAGVLMDADRLAMQQQRVEVIIRIAAKLGIYVIIDYHSHYAYKHADHAEQFFKDMATKYGKLPNVLYETYNEPITPSGTDTSAFWSDTLKPYHTRIVNAIRNAGSDNIAILGTPQWSQLLECPVADPIDLKNIMYTLHFYSCTHTDWLRNLQFSYALDRGLPVFVTEWGATDADGGTANAKVKGVCADEADKWFKIMDQYQVGWAAWKFDDCADTSCYFKTGTSPWGGWTDDDLQGHGPYVVAKMKAQ